MINEELGISVLTLQSHQIKIKYSVCTRRDEPEKMKREKYRNGECTCGMVLAKDAPFILPMILYYSSLSSQPFYSLYLSLSLSRTHILLASLNILLQSNDVQKTLEKE
jgi:hypothetical protein